MTAAGLADYESCATGSSVICDNATDVSLFECHPTTSLEPQATVPESRHRHIVAKSFRQNELTQFTSQRPFQWNRYSVHSIFIIVLMLQVCGGALLRSHSKTHVHDEAGLRKRHALARHNATMVKVDGGPQLLADYGETNVVNFAESGDVVAVLLDNATFITYKLYGSNSDETMKIKEIWRRTMKAPLPEFHDFRIINRQTLLFCANHYCEACDLNNDRMDSCTYFSLSSTNQMTFASMCGWLVGDNRLILRTVSADSTGALYSLQPGKPINFAMDRQGIDDIAVVGAFAIDRYTFFVGSASKIDVPYNIFTGNTIRRRRMDLRMTRVCNQDATSRLESRIDISLSCDGLDYGNDYLKTSPKRAKAASLSDDNSRLYILLEKDAITAYNSKEAVTPTDVVCEYDVADVLKRFDETWNTCQSIYDAAELTKSCKSGKDGRMEDPRCYIFAWSRDSRVPLCERFHMDDSNRPADNCNLAASKTKANRNYWIENYRPLMGRLVSRFNNSDVETIFEGDTSDILFASRSGAIDRLLKGDLSGTAMWTTPLASTLAVANTEVNALIFADKSQMKYVPLTCQNLYPTCKSISWSDPLGCRWCMNQRGEGHIFSVSTPQSCPDGNQSLDRCPPVIVEAIYDRDRFLVLGEGFSNVENIRIKACDEECTFDKDGNIAYCYAHPSCTIELTGRVGSLDDFHFIYSNHLKEATDNLSQVFKNNSRTIRILATIFVLFLLFAMLIAVWQLYRKYAKRIHTKMHRNSEKTTKGKYMSVSTGEFGGLPLVVRRHRHTTASSTNTTHPHMSFSGNAHTIFSSDSVSSSAFVFGGAGVIEELGGGFKLCDEIAGSVGPNTIDKTHIFPIKQIGDGNSSTVHLANYVIDPNANISRQVAVKTICNSAFDLEDVMREIDLISRCRHKNIVEYIGHFGDAFNRMHIVTEYMAGGDLHKFLIGPTNKLTVGDAFLFILQICEGMEYLTKQHIIHRDLAARNCMLDDANVVVKITDFGLCRTSNIDYEYVSENAAQQLPFRWTAIECFGTNRKFSEKSDVWSFGVVVWETFARDLTPYAGRDSNGVREYLKGGHRLEFAHIPSCPEVIYERILLPCWETLPQNRPTFTELRGEIERNYWALKNTSPEYLRTEYETPLSSIGSLTPMLPETMTPD